MKIKMFGKRSVSSLLFYLSRIGALGYAFFLLFIVTSFLVGSYSTDQDGGFTMRIPFTSSAVQGKFDSKTLIAIVLLLCFYVAFFYLLSLVFKSFKNPSLFTERAIKELRYFGMLNLIAPLPYIITVAILISKIPFSEFMGAFAHIIIGIFAMFLAAIFTQGVTIQEENDLMI